MSETTGEISESLMSRILPSMMTSVRKMSEITNQRSGTTETVTTITSSTMMTSFIKVSETTDGTPGTIECDVSKFIVNDDVSEQGEEDCR